MFKRKKKYEGIPGIKSSPYSSLRGFIMAIIIVLFGIWCLFHPTEIIKWIGYPFLIVPDALGLVDLPAKDDIGRVDGPQGSSHEFELTRTGYYNLQYAPFAGWWDNDGEYPSLRIEGPNGLVELHSIEPKKRFENGVRIDEDPIGPDGTVDSVPPRFSLFYPPQAPGLVERWFEVTEPGVYTFHYSRTSAPDWKNFHASFAPYYLLGKETVVRRAFAVQLTLLVAATGCLIYFFKIKPEMSERDAEVDSYLERQILMDDVLDDLKKRR